MGAPLNSTFSTIYEVFKPPLLEIIQDNINIYSISCSIIYSITFTPSLISLLIKAISSVLFESLFYLVSSYDIMFTEFNYLHFQTCILFLLTILFKVFCLLKYLFIYLIHINWRITILCKN